MAWRGALIAWALPALFASAALAEGVVAARYADPTTRYDHGILGDAIEHGTLEMDTDAGRRLRIVLPDSRVFEDTAPRLADLDGDGAAEVIVVETDIARGARLAVYGPAGLIAATDFIGRTHRWLAPLGAGDLDGDGKVEIAYVDRPHLAKVLKIVRFDQGRLVPVAELSGLTNHRIGDRTIAGGIRGCTGNPELVLANADWTAVMTARLDAGRITVAKAAPEVSRDSLARVMACR